MIVYAETNFILEIALGQGQSESAERIVEICESKRAELVLPAFSLIEPYFSFSVSHRRRREIIRQLEIDLGQLSRSSEFRTLRSDSEEVVERLTSSITTELERLEEIRRRLLNAARIIPLNGSILTMFAEIRNIHDLETPDAVMYASIISDLQANTAQESLFLNRNTHDFTSFKLIAELEALNCKVIPRFEDGLNYLLKRIG